VKKCAAKNHSAQLVGIADPLGDPPFEYCITESFGESPTASLSRRLNFILQSLAHWNVRRNHSHSATRLMVKKYVSNSAAQDSIMNAHKKTQLTHARINCALKDSSCDSPLPKNLKLTILASNASSSSTKVFKCPHTKNDSIFTQWFNHLKFRIKINTYTHKDKHNA
ncbi:hypothetical protein H5410_005640, partial [Solanum commersonii]